MSGSSNVNHDKQPDARLSSGTADDSKKRKSKMVKLFLKGGKAIRKVCMGLGDALEQYDSKIQAEALTPRELLTATRCVQKAHKYNVLGDKYCLLSSKYKTGSFLGSGNYGKVYEVEDIETGARFACKEINKEKVFKKGEEKTLFTEVEVMRRLRDNCYAMTMHDVLEDATNLYIVIELCWGSDVLDTLLADFQGKGSFSEADAAKVMRGMLRAVKSCHDRGVIHRDIKPDNFLWEKEGGNGNLLLADFGISTFLSRKTPCLRDTCGTPVYMAPETWMKMPYTTEADVWSLGVCLALLLTGTHPFDGNTPLELKTAICKDSINFHEKPWSDLSPSVCNLVSRMLEKDLAKRITIKEALNHRWVVQGGSAPTTSLTGAVRARVQKLINMNNLHETILVLMAKEAMTSKELPSLQKQFCACDIDGDGMISIQDMSLNMKRRGSLTSDTDAGKLVERLRSVSSDKGGSSENMLSFEQFVIGEIHLRAQVDSETRMKKAFSLLDKDGDQLISHKDLTEAMMDAGVAFSKDILDIFQQLDRDGDGCITFDEFSDFWETHLQEDQVSDEDSDEKSVFKRSHTLQPRACRVHCEILGDSMPAEGKDVNEMLKRVRGDNFVSAISRRNRLRPSWIFSDVRLHP